MKRVAWLVGLLLLALPTLCLVAYLIWGTPRRPPTSSEGRGPLPGLRDVEPKRTAILTTLDRPIPNGKSALWCASFQIAWERLKSDVTKGPVELEGAEEIVKSLNDAPSLKDAVLEDDSYAAGGFLKDGIAETINAEMARRFPDVPKLEWERDDVAGAFAYLRASLKFPLRYSDHRTALLFRGTEGKETAVRSFGISPDVMESPLFEQVQLLHYSREEKVFVLDPCKGSKPYQLLLATLPRRDTLAALLADLDKRLADPTGDEGNDFKNRISFSIPHLRFRIDHRFEELDRRAFLNPSSRGRFLRTRQWIDFRLDASGAELQSRAWPKDAKGGLLEYRFARPFLLLMRKRGETRPFFVLWVENGELLEAWD